MNSAWLEIFKTGTHTSGNGVTKTYTDDDLTSIANTYNLQKDHEAPLVLGHPSTDTPAYGWAKELKAAGGKLLAYVDQVNEAVVEAVRKGSYKKVSIALYPDGLLRHIGLLGAAPPAVKGLAAVQFSEAEFDEYIWATDETRIPTVGRIFSGLRDFFIEKFGLESADKALDKDDIAYLQRPAESKMIVTSSDQSSEVANFSEQNQQEEEKQMDELKAKVKTLEDALAAQSAQFAELQTGVKELTESVSLQAQAAADKNKLSALESMKSVFAAFCEELVREGKVLPAEKDSIIEEYADLCQAEEVLTFAEGITKPSAKMKARLESRPVIVAKGQTFASPDKAKKADAGDVPAEFSEIADRLDQNSLEIDRGIREYAEKNKVSYAEAAAKYTAA